VTENVQLVTFLTEAVSVTEPPVVISEVGATLNEMTEGLAVLAAPAATTGTKVTTATRIVITNAGNVEGCRFCRKSWVK
jgi:hypothetical protein